MLPAIKSLNLEELKAQFQSWNLPSYRVYQLLKWLYVQRATSWDAMTDLPKSLRERLGQHFTLSTLELVRTQGSRDTTEKFLWKLPDGAFIESVLLPANPALYGESSDRHTLCVSTQVGCAYGCKFCASGLDGWKRNLQVDEIVEQVLAVERVSSPAAGVPSSAAASLPEPETPSPEPGARITHHASRVTQPGTRNPELGTHGPKREARLINNLVIMGMGEPLANYDNLLKALNILNAPWGGGIGARKITISTSGLAPQIRQLAGEPVQFRLAISLHGATDEVRNQIMPVNRKYPLAELIAACEEYLRRKERMITFEYILIAGVNDDVAQTRPLAALARQLNAKINLIPYNTVQGLPWQRPSEAVQEKFLAALAARDVTATLRREKGHDIDAACGQLRLRTERELAKG